jgi:hypothetical protein
MLLIIALSLNVFRFFARAIAPHKGCLDHKNLGRRAIPPPPPGLK